MGKHVHEVKHMRTTAVLFLIVAVLMGHPTQAGQTTLRVNGVPVKTTLVTRQGHTMVPLQTIIAALGADVQPDAGQRIVRLTHRGNILEMGVGSRRAMLNGRPQDLAAAPQIVGNRLMLPLRSVVTLLDGSIRSSSNGIDVAFAQPPTVNVTLLSPAPGQLLSGTFLVSGLTAPDADVDIQLMPTKTMQLDVSPGTHVRTRSDALGRFSVPFTLGRDAGGASFAVDVQVTDTAGNTASRRADVAAGDE